MAVNAEPRKVLLAGATGLVGGLILQALLADAAVAELHALSRRDLGIAHPKLRVHLVDFKQLPELPAVDEVYLALGTTIKVAGSQAAFRAVDLEANLAVARAAFAGGPRRVGLVSAAAANAKSSVFYNRVKGDLEDALKAMNFGTLVIAQPSLLIGDRERLNQPPRLAEKIATPLMQLISPLLPGAYKPVRAGAVAHALVRTVPSAQGVVVLDSAALISAGS
jgi:uncharacterized protein YbjT (DUF2867 family)